MLNSTIAANFDLIADLLDFQGANPFRVRAYRNSARTIRDYPESLAALAAEGKARLMKIEGIGPDPAAKILTLVETGELRRHVRPNPFNLHEPGLPFRRSAEATSQL